METYGISCEAVTKFFLTSCIRSGSHTRRD